MTVLMCLVFFLIFPYFCGKALLVWIGLLTKQSGTGALSPRILPASAAEALGSVLAGTVVLWAVFEVLAVPLILKEASFSVLRVLWLAVAAGICVLLIVTVLILKKRGARTTVPAPAGNVFGLNGGKITSNGPSSASVSVSEPERKPGSPDFVTLLILILLAVPVLLQCMQYINGMHIDWDDTRFVAHAVETWSHGTMLTVNPATGAYAGLNYGDVAKDIVAPWPVYLALGGWMTGIHPAVFAHTVLPPVYLLLMYAAYWLIGRTLFSGSLNKSLLFTALIAFVMLFFGGNTRSAADFTLVRIWQGKAVLAAIGIPLLFLVFLLIANGKRHLAWLLLPLNLGCCMVSSMSVVLIGVAMGILALYLLICARTWRLLPPLLAGGLPTVVMGLVYMSIK
ncbi:MAG: hypothetical protein HUJ73_06740 [Eubacterium sp.]|nr:hypothetical protein [Eubacterium sp.]